MAGRDGTALGVALFRFAPCLAPPFCILRPAVADQAINMHAEWALPPSISEARWRVEGARASSIAAELHQEARRTRKEWK